MKTIKTESSIIFSRPYLMFFGIAASIPPAGMFLIILYKSFESGGLEGGFFILFPIVWMLISIPLSGSRKVWHLDKHQMALEITHKIFNYSLRKKVFDLRNYQGVAWGVIRTQIAGRIYYSFLTLVHSCDPYRDIYGVGKAVSDKNHAKKKAKEYAEFLNLPFLGRHDSKSLGHQIHGN